MPKTYVYSDAIIEAALIRNFGNITMAAADIGMCTVQLRKRVNKMENAAKFSALRHELEEQVLDLAEAGKVQHILRGSESMIKFELLQKGRRRGYGMRTEVQMEVTPVLEPVVRADALGEDEQEIMRTLLARQKAVLG